MAKQTAKKSAAVDGEKKLYYQFDKNGVYTGPVEAAECPENATETVPPADGDDTQSAVWNGVEWRQFPNATIDASIKARAKRDALLSECDYTQLADFGGDAKAWAEYRKELREVPKQKAFPLEIEWPEKPTAKAEEPKK
jgi:hypothetical protein